MAYPKKLLNDHETVALDVHPHWWYFAKAAAAVVVSVVIGILALVALDGTLGKVVGWLAVALIVVSAMWLVARYLKWVSINFVVTSDRVIYRSGIFAKSGIEIPLDRVNNVIFGQSFVERLLGAGNLLIESGGETGQQRFTDVRQPDRVQMIINAQKSALRSAAAPVGGAQPADVASQLEKLEGLLERGTITQEEFDEQKRRILGG
jgi:uncharacterized membrane protein YdbT with pleckstrin-like domain